MIPSQSVGILVARHGAIVGADLFVNATLCRKLRQKVLDSYSLDCIGGPKVQFRRPSQGQALNFLHRVYRARLSYTPTPGAGRLARLTGAIGGSALIRDGAVIHVSLFPVPIARPMPVR